MNSIRNNGMMIDFWRILSFFGEFCPPLDIKLTKIVPKKYGSLQWGTHHGYFTVSFFLDSNRDLTSTWPRMMSSKVSRSRIRNDFPFIHSTSAGRYLEL